MRPCQKPRCNFFLAAKSTGPERFSDATQTTKSTTAFVRGRTNQSENSIRTENALCLPHLHIREFTLKKSQAASARSPAWRLRITAFIGRTLRGPVNEPTIVNNFAEFERLFGGLAADHTVAYAVQDFFSNGGAQAIIVRFYRPFFPDDVTREAAFAKATIQAQTAASAVSAAATAAARLAGATPASVALAANGAITGAAGSAAFLEIGTW